MGYELISGKPEKYVVLRCMKCNDIIMKAPLNCTIRPDRSVVVDNSKCMFARHPIRAELVN